MAGLPKLGDKSAWATLQGQGIADLTASVVGGADVMTPKVGSAAADAEVKDEATYKINAAK